ncbi:MAG TPA: hypothetical protein VFP71_00675 [Candidatus Angelobacter sp.]|nr:hypothetical protein [Candidatus Angelobacter sp.]
MLKNNNDMKPATAEDVEKGSAVFYVPDSRSKVYELGFSLPAEAVVVSDIEVGDGEKIPVGTALTIIQAEIVDNRDVLLGFSYKSVKGVCSDGEVQFKGKSAS